jgi:hypothetical protein
LLPVATRRTAASAKHKAPESFHPRGAQEHAAFLPSLTDISCVGRFALAAKIDGVLKLSIIASLLLASSGVGYYYAVYLPGRDAQLDNEIILEKTQAFAHKRAEQARSLAEQQVLEKRLSAEKAAADIGYQTCLDSAGAARIASWAEACKRLAETALANHADCLSKSKLSPGYCDAAYKTRDASPNCTLPVKIAADLDGALNMARKSCLRQRDAALR